ncbi:hypothetical protein GGD63_000824 [Bradyrhizobium sp. cir1]|uniref:hypothetical protein n=1 Tax=Bradyrhizobium sp. cir1 TaxID=1445730 RepID=UPI0016061141|nr:hypothetical protein [Bradyrhizobium sp. cir1]MBB4368055.1 hypothetical protein [Bradyrhizobium sp. cir1]
MGNRTAKFVSALVGSIIAGAPLAAVSQNAPGASSTAGAADECLASPKGAAPQGQHWRYRVERGTKRQCWYLRAEGAKTTQGAQATDGQNADAAAPPSVQNARAEYIAPQTGAAPIAPNMTAPAAATAPPVAVADTNSEQPAVAARWPDTSATSAASQPMPAPVAPAPQPGAKPAAAEIPADKPTGSLQMLLLVVGGALALAGILASVIYRFGGARVRVQASEHRRVNWDDREHQNQDRAPWLNAMPATPRARRPRPIDFDAVRPQAAQLAAIDREIDVIEAQEPPATAEAAQRDADKFPVFDQEFEIETRAPRLDANDAAEQRDDRDEDAVDVDVITAMLERLAKEGPRLKQPSPAAELAALAQSRRGPSAARA